MILIGSMFLKILFWQAGVAAVVIIILMLVLNRSLLETALRQAEFLSQRVGRGQAQQVVVISKGGLSSSYAQRLEKKLRGNLGETVIFHYHADRNILGGVIIKFADAVIDYSLKDRLLQAAGRKPPA